MCVNVRCDVCVSADCQTAWADSMLCAVITGVLWTGHMWMVVTRGSVVRQV